jgi:hypothetical protein
MGYRPHAEPRHRFTAFARLRITRAETIARIILGNHSNGKLGGYKLHLRVKLTEFFVRK